MLYTKELREEVCRRRQAGEQGTALSEELGIPLTTIYRWSTPGASEKHRKRNSQKYHEDLQYAEKVRERTKSRNKNRYNNDEDYRLGRILKGLRNKANERGHKPCFSTVEELKSAYTGQCHCCGEYDDNLSKSLCVDHCHETGRFRGWLCNSCNKALGLCRDNPRMLVEYLESTSP